MDILEQFEVETGSDHPWTRLAATCVQTHAKTSQQELNHILARTRTVEASVISHVSGFIIYLPFYDLSSRMKVHIQKKKRSKTCDI